MTNLGIIYDNIKRYSEMNKFDLFADCVKQKLQIHLVDYYYRLSAKLERAYNQVMNAEDLKALRYASKELSKAERPKY